MEENKEFKLVKCEKIHSKIKEKLAELYFGEAFEVESGLKDEYYNSDLYYSRLDAGFLDKISIVEIPEELFEEIRNTKEFHHVGFPEDKVARYAVRSVSEGNTGGTDFFTKDFEFVETDLNGSSPALREHMNGKGRQNALDWIDELLSDLKEGSYY